MYDIFILFDSDIYLAYNCVPYGISAENRA